MQYLKSNSSYSVASEHSTLQRKVLSLYPVKRPRRSHIRISSQFFSTSSLFLKGPAYLIQEDPYFSKKPLHVPFQFHSSHEKHARHSDLLRALLIAHTKKMRPLRFEYSLNFPFGPELNKLLFLYFLKVQITNSSGCKIETFNFLPFSSRKLNKEIS